MRTGPLTESQIKQFHQDGYLFIKPLLDEEETQLLIQAAREDQAVHKAAMGVEDAAGKKSKLSLWNHPGDDIWGMVSRSKRIVEGAEQLLEDEVYHYHSKLMLKEPKVGGAWEWHQDYGYWYQNGCLLPDMVSCLIALDAATRENGCLQVLRGSHKMGRVEHGRFGQQTGADPERVEWARQMYDLVHCEMQPGEALFFHGNTLHGSSANTSDKSRWSLICCYNTKTNNPFKEHHHPRYTPLSKVEDDAIKKVGLKLTDANDANKWFLDLKEDKTTVGAAEDGQES